MLVVDGRSEVMGAMAYRTGSVPTRRYRPQSTHCCDSVRNTRSDAVPRWRATKLYAGGATRMAHGCARRRFGRNRLTDVSREKP